MSPDVDFALAIVKGLVEHGMGGLFRLADSATGAHVGEAPWRVDSFTTDGQESA